MTKFEGTFSGHTTEGGSKTAEAGRAHQTGDAWVRLAFAPLLAMNRLLGRDGVTAWTARLLSHPVRTYREDTAARAPQWPAAESEVWS